MSLSLKVVDMEVCTQLVEPKKATGGQMLSGLAWCRHRPGEIKGNWMIFLQETMVCLMVLCVFTPNWRGLKGIFTLRGKFSKSQLICNWAYGLVSGNTIYPQVDGFTNLGLDHLRLVLVKNWKHQAVKAMSCYPMKNSRSNGGTCGPMRWWSSHLDTTKWWFFHGKKPLISYGKAGNNRTYHL